MTKTINQLSKLFINSFSINRLIVAASHETSHCNKNWWSDSNICSKLLLLCFLDVWIFFTSPVSVLSGEASPGQQSADYVVGQVSGSLFQQRSAAAGSLSALFSSAAPAASVLFQPAPKVRRGFYGNQEAARFKTNSTAVKVHTSILSVKRSFRLWKHT